MPPSARTIARGLAPHGLVLLHDEWTRIQVGRARLIRRAPRERLRDVAWLEHELLPRLGLADLHAHSFPSELAPAVGEGLQPFQWPNQLAPYLAALSRYPITSYLEIGAFRGGMFIVTCEYLARFERLERAIAVDLEEIPGLRRYRLLRPQARLVRTRSGTPEFRAQVERWRPDLAFIDADHHYPSVRNDFASVDGIAKVIGFHDVVDPYCPGSMRFWDELRETRGDDYHFAEFAAQYPEVNERFGVDAQFGIGLAVRKDFGPAPA